MILDARKLVNERLVELKNRVDKLNRKPVLAIIRVGDDKASERYVNNKIKRCKEVCIDSKVVHLDSNVNDLEVGRAIIDLNWDSRVTGILLQLPLPSHLDEKYLTSLILSEKDVDGFTIDNMGKLLLGKTDGNTPCTPTGIVELLKYYNVEMDGKDVLIVNRSNIVGKPLAHLLLEENATVTVAHSKTKNLKKKILDSDIVVLGVGIPNFLGIKDFRQGQTIVDVSINFLNSKMCGDVNKNDYGLLNRIGCNITPVPNGIGRMTVLSL